MTATDDGGLETVTPGIGEIFIFITAFRIVESLAPPSVWRGLSMRKKSHPDTSYLVFGMTLYSIPLTSLASLHTP